MNFSVIQIHYASASKSGFVVRSPCDLLLCEYEVIGSSCSKTHYHASGPMLFLSNRFSSSPIAFPRTSVSELGTLTTLESSFFSFFSFFFSLSKEGKKKKHKKHTLGLSSSSSGPKINILSSNIPNS